MHLRAMRRILSGASCVVALSVMVLPGHAAPQSPARHEHEHGHPGGRGWRRR